MFVAAGAGPGRSGNSIRDSCMGDRALTASAIICCLLGSWNQDGHMVLCWTMPSESRPGHPHGVWTAVANAYTCDCFNPQSCKVRYRIMCFPHFMRRSQCPEQSEHRVTTHYWDIQRQMIIIIVTIIFTYGVCSLIGIVQGTVLLCIQSL